MVFVSLVSEISLESGGLIFRACITKGDLDAAKSGAKVSVLCECESKL